jgi:hypothetical protein
MFSTKKILATVGVAAATLLSVGVLATPAQAAPTTQAAGGNAYACNVVTDVSGASGILELLGVNISSLQGPIGLTCTPVNLGSSTTPNLICASSLANGLVAIDCDYYTGP